MTPSTLEIVSDDGRNYRDVVYHSGGSEAEVYSAVYKPTNQRVALKVLRRLGGAEATRDRREQRFLREATILRQITNSRVVRVYEVLDVRLRGEPTKAFSMEWLPETFASRLDHHPDGLPVDLLETYLAQAGEGLRALHAAGVAVRDMRPENLLLSDRGELKISDLGLARTDDSATSLVESSRYMAPEVLNGTIRNRSGGADPPAEAYFTSDVYALGLIFYEAAVGANRWEKLPALSPVFAEEGAGSGLDRNQRWREWHLDPERSLPPVKGCRKDLPSELAATIDGMAAKRQEDRTAEGQLAAEASAGQPVAPDSNPPKKKERPATKVPAWVVLAAIAILAVTVLALWWALRERRIEIATIPPGAVVRFGEVETVGATLLRVATSDQTAILRVSFPGYDTFEASVGDAPDAGLWSITLTPNCKEARSDRLRVRVDSLDGLQTERILGGAPLLRAVASECEADGTLAARGEVLSFVAGKQEVASVSMLSPASTADLAAAVEGHLTRTMLRGLAARGEDRLELLVTASQDTDASNPVVEAVLGPEAKVGLRYWVRSSRTGRLLLLETDSAGSALVLVPGWGGMSLLLFDKWMQVPDRAPDGSGRIPKLEFFAPSNETVYALLLPGSAWDSTNERLSGLLQEGWGAEDLHPLAPGPGDGTGLPFRLAQELQSLDLAISASAVVDYQVLATEESRE